MKFKPFISAAFLILLVACTSGLNPTIGQTEPAQPTVLASTPTNTKLSQAPTAASTQTVEETGLKTPCREVPTKLLNEVKSRGVVILENRASLDQGHYKGGTFLLDMTNGKTTSINIDNEGQIDPVVSPDKSLMAYESIIFNLEGKPMESELIVADATGNRIKEISWEEDWFQIPVWLDNERLRILLQTPEQDSGEEHRSVVVLNPFTGERKILKHDLPGFLDTSLAVTPYWEGQWGVIYDPALMYAIYPQSIGNKDEKYTYVVWDLSKQRPVVSLENIFTSFSGFNYYPMPKWSLDGSRFVFQGSNTTSGLTAFELYEVSREGQTKQLTELSSVAYVLESTYSWSPDGSHIAMFLQPILDTDSEKAHLAVLDMKTLNMTDYCVEITFSGEGYGGAGTWLSPIWSPGGKQILVTDWYEKDHRHVILVDIEKNVATQIAEDMEPMGWMITP